MSDFLTIAAIGLHLGSVHLSEGEQVNPDYDLNTPAGVENSKQWLTAHLQRIVQGGTWVVPRSMSIIHCDHENKRATVRFSMMPDPSLGVVFKAIGWEYKEN